MNKIIKSNRVLEEQLLDSVAAIKPYVAKTNNIEISVWPEFIDSKSSIIGDLFIWSYQVRIDNKSNDSVRLISRYWRIIDENGTTQEVSGDGVIGEQPIIIPGSSYQYTSGVHLKYPSGIMTGKYQMRNLIKDELFEVKIPTFSLDVPTIRNVLN